MVNDDFYANLRAAIGYFQNPSCEPASMWLWLGTIHGYQEKDFDFLDSTVRNQLDTSVTEFRKIAETVPITEEPNAQEIADAKRELETILQITQPVRYSEIEAFRIEVKLNEAFRGKLPKGVTGIKCQSNFDHMDEPVLRIWIEVRERTATRGWIINEGNKFVKVVNSAARRLLPKHFVSTQFRAPTEEPQKQKVAS